MANLTRHGVCYDLSDTPFVAHWGGYKFHFSSLKHQQKFTEGIDARIDWLNDSLSRRFKYPIHADELAVFQWYMQVESRGFRVSDDAYACTKSDDIHFHVGAATMLRREYE